MFEVIPNWHPILVHFTIALLSVSCGLFLVGVLAKCEQAVLVAKWNLWIGAAVTLLTIAAGFYAYNSVAHDDPSHLAMNEHKDLALVTIALLLPVVIWSVISHRKSQASSLPFVGLFLLVSALLIGTAWHGGELVYRYGLGVMSLPNTDSHDHAGHDHGEHSGASNSGHEHQDHAHSGTDDHHSHEADSMNHRDMMDDSAMDFSGMGFDDTETDETMTQEAGTGQHDGHDHMH